MAYFPDIYFILGRRPVSRTHKQNQQTERRNLLPYYRFPGVGEQPLYKTPGGNYHSRYMFYIRKDEEGDPIEVMTKDRGLVGTIIICIVISSMMISCDR